MNNALKAALESNGFRDSQATTTSKSNQKNNPKQVPGNSKASQTTTTSSETAYAPYNFVALPPETLPAPLNKLMENSCDLESMKTAYAKYLQQPELLSGYIQLEIETITPTFIGGADDNDFYKIADKYAIPGSSIRGMVKNYLKIITLGAMRATDNEDIFSRKLYFRNIAGSIETKTQKALYLDRMQSKTSPKITKSGKKIYPNNSQAGFLLKIKNEYYIYPATAKEQKYKDANAMNDAANRIYWSKDHVLYHTGKINGKRHYFIITPNDWSKSYKVPNHLLESYREDKFRGGVNLLQENKSQKEKPENSRPECLCKTAEEIKNLGYHTTLLKNAPSFQTIVPCHFVLDSANELESFGFGKYYRIPYKTSIGNHIPPKVNTTVIDFADSIFGKKDLWSSRLAFEDHYLELGTNLDKRDSYQHKPLLGPKPTSYQLYLEEENNNHWDTENLNIRGYKMYWHKDIVLEDWISPENKNSNIVKKITVMPKGVKFSGKIHFDRLTNIELGALLKVFNCSPNSQQQEKYYHKIGMGKPLGLGSINITAQLHLINLVEHYSSFLEESSTSINNVDNYIKAFENYTIDLNFKKSYDSIIKNLQLLMKWNSIPKKQAQYMPLQVNDPTKGRNIVNHLYTKRIVLPSANKFFK